MPPATPFASRPHDACEESPLPAWNQAKAERLLAELRAEVERIKANFGGQPPASLVNVLADALAIAESYIVKHEAEAARGWDALELLRGMLPRVHQLAAWGAWLRPEAVPETHRVAQARLRQWDAESSALIAWFRRHRPEFPQKPFRLARHRLISNPAKWYAALEQDIAAGPLGVQARMGALTHDLCRLRALVETEGRSDQ